MECSWLAAWKMTDGKLWFATQKGLAVVDPRNVRSNAVPPEVFIEEVLADGVAMFASILHPDRDGLPDPSTATRVR
jgi:hypothetical protein